MLDRFTSLPHLLWMLVEPPLNRFENVLMLPSRDPSLLTGGATPVDGAVLAGFGRVSVQDQSVFFGCE
jgi:hypothetical protein